MRFTSEPASTMLPMKTPVFFDLMSMVTYDTVRVGVRSRELSGQMVEKIIIAYRCRLYYSRSKIVNRRQNCMHFEKYENSDDAREGS
jgi:hypothetical protein